MIYRCMIPSRFFPVPPLSFYYMVYVICFQFFLSHWEKYNTGVLYLPWAYDLSQVNLSNTYCMLCLIFIKFYCTNHRFGFVYNMEHLSCAAASCCRLLANILLRRWDVAAFCPSAECVSWTYRLNPVLRNVLCDVSSHQFMEYVSKILVSLSYTSPQPVASGQWQG